MLVSVDRLIRPLSRPPSVGVKMLRRGLVEVSGRIEKSAPNKNHDCSAKRRA
jgi:hypothetical protein